MSERAKRIQQIPYSQILYALCSLLLALGFSLYALCFTLYALGSLFFCTPAFAEGLSGWANLNYITTEQKEDSETISKERSFYRNLYLTFERPLTPLISYQLYLRTNWSDFRLTDADNRVTNTYQRAIEPAFDIFLRNPMYDFSTGYRRMEQWTTASLQNEGRRTTDFMYSRLNITPRELPSLSLQIDRQKNFDYLSPRRIDITDTRFTGNSWYQYLYKDLNLSYNFTYTHDIVETPSEIIEKTKNYNFNGIYNISYNRAFWAGKANISANYQGNYVRDKNRFSIKEEGTASLERLRLQGLYINDPTPDDMTSLNPQPSLINNQYTDSTGITLNTSFQNIGTQVELRSISKISIYYRNNGVADPVTWRIYHRNNNLENWSLITTLTVSPTFDSVNNAYRYELTFPSKIASFFKVVNVNIIPPVAGSNVEVSEINVFDIETITETGTLTEVNNFFNQGVNLTANVRPIQKLGFSLNYFINRSDQNPVSIWNSIGGIFSNIASKSINDNDRLISNVLRIYGGSAEWLTHRLLTTTLRFQRNEAFDNRAETDFSSNTYSLTFNSVPLPTLDANLSLIRNDNYNFGEKDNTNNSVLLSIVAKLYKDVNMVTDMGYTRSKSYTLDTKSDTTSIRGSIDANLTQKLYASLIYGFSRTSSSDNTSIDTTEGQTIITYRPGRFINITGTLRAMDIDGDTTTSEGILIDWLPLPTLRLNLNYLHSNSEIEPTMSDILSTYLIWYITKFLDLQITYSYTREEREQVEKIHSVGANLNCRFW
ncbi:MAG: hypothetical protein HXY47_03125 [Nitrospirae bacterium]|nr:hypothetical protein [Nitrospirota bacterium]